MKRTVQIIAAAVLAAVCAYAVFYSAATASNRALLEAETPELGWLKREFSLSEAEFARISALHEAYLPKCAERCQQIADRNRELRELLSRTNVMTRAIEQSIEQAAQIRMECEKSMLEHFLDVSRTMPADQGKRYLDWVQRRTLLANPAMSHVH
ncbi:MAG: periplasmic heavy metal sensor [Verrucomicrobia bacterium]|nr:periplasmic heavy metal sensor [Verrucomicrobiota bacterium]